MAKLDLHGYTVHEAWREYTQWIQGIWWQNEKSVIVVTGHGKIKEEFPEWCRVSPYVRTCELNLPNTGAYKLTLWKRNDKRKI